MLPPPAHLGGVQVFTSTAVCDIGAFAPRDYAKGGDPATTGSNNRAEPAPPSAKQGPRKTSTIRVGNTVYRAVLTDASQKEVDNGEDIDWSVTAAHPCRPRLHWSLLKAGLPCRLHALGSHSPYCCSRSYSVVVGWS